MDETAWRDLVIVLNDLAVAGDFKTFHTQVCRHHRDCSPSQKRQIEQWWIKVNPNVRRRPRRPSATSKPR